MLTFTPLSGAAKSSRTSPLAYLLQVDDINILLDCGSPDWCPEPFSATTEGDDVTENDFYWERYCDKLREYVVNDAQSRSPNTDVNCCSRTGSHPPSTSSFSPMEISHTLDCTLTRTQGGASKRRRILPSPCRPWPASPQRKKQRAFATRRMWVARRSRRHRRATGMCP